MGLVMADHQPYPDHHPHHPSCQVYVVNVQVKLVESEGKVVI